MRRYDWPGNVRELRNYVQRAYIMADGDRIEASAIDLPLLPDQASRASRTGPGAGAQVSIPVGVSLAEADRRLIVATLQQCGGVKKHTAEVLGISLKTLYNRLSEYAATGHEPDGEARPD